MNILLTGSNPDSKSKVAGIGAVINILLKNPLINYIQLPVGRSIGEKYGFQWLRKQFSIFYKLSQIVKHEDIKIAHVNSSLDNAGILRDFLIIRWLKFKNVNYFYHLHGGKYSKYKIKNAFVKYCLNFNLKNAKKIIVLSEIEKKTVNISERFLNKIISIPNSIDFAEVESLSVEKKNNILFMGRIVKDKGIYEISKAIALLNSRTQKFEFHLAGDGPDKNLFVNEMASILGERFKYHGVVIDNEKWKLFKESIILLLPSKYEGLPMVILEAMASEVVVVASDVGSIFTVVKNNETGFLLNTDKNIVKEMADIVYSLIFNEQERIRITKNAMKNIKLNNSMGSYHKKINEIYANF